MPPWEKYQQQTQAPASDGPWSKYAQPAPAQQEPTWAEPGVLAPIQYQLGPDGRPVGARLAVPQIISGAIDAIMAPGKAARGEYGMEIDADTGHPTTMTNDMIGDTMGLAGFGAMSPASRAGAAFGQAVISSPARRMVERALKSDNVPLDQVGPRLSALGREAVVADLGPNVRARAAAIATAPGNGAPTIVDTLAARRAASNSRIQGDVNNILGPAVVPSEVDAGLRASQRALSPLYEQALEGAKAVDTSPIALALDSIVVNERGAAQSAARQVREMLNIVGTNELDPNPRTLLNTREAIDGILFTGTGAAPLDSNVERILRQARGAIDAELAAKVPGIKDVDAQFAELARQRTAVGKGQTVLETGRQAPRPAEVQSMMTEGALPGGTMIGPSAVPLRLRDGARAEIDRIIGTNARDINAMKRIMAGEGNWNRDRLVSVFGKDKAERLLQVLEREAAFNATEELALNGSRTQVLKAAQDAVFGSGPKPNPLRSALNLQMGSALADLGDRTIGVLSGARRGAINEDLARALMMNAEQAGVLNRPSVLSEGNLKNLARALTVQQMRAAPITYPAVAEALSGPRR